MSGGCWITICHVRFPSAECFWCIVYFLKGLDTANAKSELRLIKCSIPSHHLIISGQQVYHWWGSLNPAVLDGVWSENSVDEWKGEGCKSYTGTCNIDTVYYWLENRKLWALGHPFPCFYIFTHNISLPESG